MWTSATGREELGAVAGGPARNRPLLLKPGRLTGYPLGHGTHSGPASAPKLLWGPPCDEGGLFLPYPSLCWVFCHHILGWPAWPASPKTPEQCPGARRERCLGSEIHICLIVNILCERGGKSDSGEGFAYFISTITISVHENWLNYINGMFLFQFCMQLSPSCWLQFILIKK